MSISDIRFDSNGLVTAVVQDVNTKEVLMVAYMNQKALDQTILTGQTWFFSRSRNQLWHKGETSGNFQSVKAIRYDCDGDALLIEVEPLGPACHTGEQSCFFRSIIHDESTENISVITRLFETVKERKANPKEGSYTNYLFDKGIDKILKKVGEETSEVIIAAKNDSKDELIYETADLVYHMTVLLVEKGINPQEIAAELKKRVK
ncbi:MAG: bifunctional phosphoribosyl-AMP cyclohydrolase/phosphoribosyl-ATP pyrophosphatase [Firmicutes bacterium HGW-Firmicutes-20]|jgi:phosphoribosyl-ATP pyrophosphohydrolase/phosphoribosyl-AMP cyclohydrolase|nr:MAG: bifunctional phosphoribosyl-AMP cyclohydrolase/phosphoribosyl-ATP pyrophosphatase [Firmicutes bacterium HGW-Firmicutes-20]PKM69365.1 MAG: bifunctional phosphoribosyl-AMP cyclohydrolase/phosphoribosyl-ATP pyrophosphatase [Firmicutes bacterium HGW-Firmicutes-19]